MASREKVAAANKLQKAKSKQCKQDLNNAWSLKPSIRSNNNNNKPESMWPYLVEIPHSERQSSPWRIVRLSFAISVACDIQVDPEMNILL